jgi:hypothetical protein
MNIIARFNKFFGLAHHYQLFYSIYVDGKQANLGIGSFFTYKHSNITNYDAVKSSLIDGFDSRQLNLMKSPENLIITGISYLGYFKVKK